MTASNSYYRARYRRLVAEGRCSHCGHPRAPGDPLLCATCRDRRRRADAAAKRADPVGPTGHVVRRGEVDRPEPCPIRCRVCYDLPHRRPPEGCWSCGEEYAPEDMSDLALRVMTSSRSGWCWGER